MAESPDDLKKRLYGSIPSNIILSRTQRKMIENLIDIAYMEGQSNQLRVCTNHMIKEAKDANSDK